MLNHKGGLPDFGFAGKVLARSGCKYLHYIVVVLLYNAKSKEEVPIIRHIKETSETLKSVYIYKILYTLYINDQFD